MSKRTENTGFTCLNCGADVKPQTNGSYRNHCPFCLFSLHIDVTPGDRQNDCLGIMEPCAVIYNSKKGWQIEHKCLKCGFKGKNLTVSEGVQPDDFDLILKLMNKGVV